MSRDAQSAYWGSNDEWETAIMHLSEKKVQAWLEDKADQWVADGQFSSDTLPGIEELGVRAEVDETDLRSGTLDPIKIKHLQFFCVWLGLELTAIRPPRSS